MRPLSWALRCNEDRSRYGTRGECDDADLGIAQDVNGLEGSDRRRPILWPETINLRRCGLDAQSMCILNERLGIPDFGPRWLCLVVLARTTGEQEQHDYGFRLHDANDCVTGAL